MRKLTRGTIADMAARLRKGQVSPVDVTDRPSDAYRPAERVAQSLPDRFARARHGPRRAAPRRKSATAATAGRCTAFRWR